jgi:hypothetical protein
MVAKGNMGLSVLLLTTAYGLQLNLNKIGIKKLSEVTLLLQIRQLDIEVHACKLSTQEVGAEGS